MAKINIKNIESVLAQADETDTREGREAYKNYNGLFRSIAKHYNTGFVQTVAAFVSLSPNQSYALNLRSLVSLIIGVRDGVPIEDIHISGYRHCLHRAYVYLVGERDFLLDAKGPKIRSFYCNIIDPKGKHAITIDGHMYSIWCNKRMPLKAVPRGRVIAGKRYEEIADDFRAVARRHKLLPSQLQGIVWFTWKRINNIVYSPQYRLGCSDDFWGLKISPEDIIPFRRKG